MERGVELVGAVAAGMRGRDELHVPRQPLVERHEIAGDAMDIGEAVQIDERIAAARLGHGDLAPADVDGSCCHLWAEAIAGCALSPLLRGEGKKVSHMV